ncbi:FkbM family methyltransferase [Sphingobium vermicomposti]|uniref:FkbM family methyltransferase n=1 Tax=Sphingobium vermicomposti TaxID=529005 RepID=A0A846MFQ3_9SPHN|nr:FkbM family methyltransferase [Sphingobium vermicomposti]NIJ15456.1 FkbM family methyltransferase [Sphingobium vermicomposti]
MRPIDTVRRFFARDEEADSPARTPRDYLTGAQYETINVMTSCSNERAEVIQVLICSLSETHRNQRINFWLFHTSINDEKLSEFDRYCRSLPNVDFFEVRVGDKHLPHFEEMKRIGGKPDSERFLWFVAHEYLPQDLDRVVYLDALDTAVVDDLTAFYQADFDGKYLLVCRELNKWTNEPQLYVEPAREFFDRTQDKETVVRISQGIFNSGSIVINLNKFRAESLSLTHYCEVAQWAKDTVGAGFGDQGLWSLTHGSNFKLMDDRYNYRFFSYGPKSEVSNPSVIHFAGFAKKPFHLFFTPKQTKDLIEHIAKAGKGPIMMGNFHRLDSHYFAHYEKWWDYCKKTPVFSRIISSAIDETNDKVIAPLWGANHGDVVLSPAGTGAAAKPKGKSLDNVVNPQGIRVYVDENDTRGQKLVAAGGHLNPETMRAWKLLILEKRWTHLLDVGANYGEMLVHTPLPIGAKVFAFEPNPTILRRLRRTIRESGLANINIIGSAMSDHEGVQTLYVDPKWSGTTRFSRDGDTPKNYKPVEVNTTTLGTVLSRIADRPQDISLLLKIDVEGHEVPVLKGLIPVLPSLADFECLIEVVHLPDGDLDFLIQHFALRGYNKAQKKLVPLSARNAKELREAMKAPEIYGQDAVLSRK